MALSASERHHSRQRNRDGQAELEVDAKSLYHVLRKGSADSRQDRRNATEMAIVADSLARIGPTIRWIPHPQTPADGLSKAELTKTNGALEDAVGKDHGSSDPGPQPNVNEGRRARTRLNRRSRSLLR